MEKNLNAEIAEKELTQTGKSLHTGIKIMAYALNVGKITLWEMKGFALNVLQKDILRGLLDIMLIPKSSRREIGLNRKKSEQDELKKECVKCGKVEADAGYKTCTKCRIKARNAKRNKRRNHKIEQKREWVANGRCWLCGEPVFNHTKLCEIHYNKSLEYVRKSVEVRHKNEQARAKKISRTNDESSNEQQEN